MSEVQVAHRECARKDGGEMVESKLERELGNLLNCHSAENASDTPDFILAKFLMQCLAAWNDGVVARQKWYAPLEEADDQICVEGAR